MSDAFELIRLERQRQDAKWGGATHDDHHDAGELSVGAAAYALQAADDMRPNHAPLGKVVEAAAKLSPCNHTKPRSPVENLVRAGALVVAEIERMARAAGGPRSEILAITAAPVPGAPRPEGVMLDELHSWDPGADVLTLPPAAQSGPLHLLDEHDGQLIAAMLCHLDEAAGLHEMRVVAAAHGYELRGYSFESKPDPVLEARQDAGENILPDWQPTPPDGQDWSLAGKWDTEDGPWCCFVRPLNPEGLDAYRETCYRLAADRLKRQIQERKLQRLTGQR